MEWIKKDGGLVSSEIKVVNGIQNWFLVAMLLLKSQQLPLSLPEYHWEAYQIQDGRSILWSNLYWEQPLLSQLEDHATNILTMYANSATTKLFTLSSFLFIHLSGFLEELEVDIGMIFLGRFVSSSFAWWMKNSLQSHKITATLYFGDHL